MTDNAFFPEKSSRPIYVFEMHHEFRDFLPVQSAMTALQECSDLLAGLASKQFAGSLDEVTADKRACMGRVTTATAGFVQFVRILGSGGRTCDHQCCNRDRGA